LYLIVPVLSPRGKTMPGGCGSGRLRGARQRGKKVKDAREMHSHSLGAWRHQHVFLGADHTRNERRTWIVIGLTAAMMAGEIAAGILFGSMALLADGIHMATHAGALSIAAAAYLLARRHAGDAQFSFGTGKLGSLAGYSSALILAVAAALIGIESVVRLTEPIEIRFDEAIAVAVLGLIVNLASAWLLQERTARDHQPCAGEAGDGAADHHHDHNLRAAYLHVLSDALTSLLAIAALVTGRAFGWVWMDPLMGIVGSVVIARWSWGLLRGTGAVLLDVMPDPSLARQIHHALEQDGDRVADLHLWRIGPGHLGLILSIVSDHPQAPGVYKTKLQALRPFSHVTVEVHPCHSGP
jgi:cation diffusion facilitator family transporter